MSYQRRALAAINITPLVDVLLILLVIMMLAMPQFVKRLPVELPHTSLTGVPTPAQTLYVAINANGVLTVDEVVVTPEMLLARVSAETSVELAADRDARYDVIAKTVALLQGAGVTRIALLSN